MSEQREMQDKKARRGWWFSVTFMLVIVGLILFLTYVEITSKNRDIVVGILGVITGSISSMLAIASGRDPSEVEELKDQLSAANADREALIARLRDSQIQLQMKNAQLFEIQTAVIDKLSLFSNQQIIHTKREEQVVLDPVVEEWLPRSDMS